MMMNQDRRTDAWVTTFLLIVIGVSLWTLLGCIEAYQQATQLGGVALALLGVVISAGGLIGAGGVLVLWWPKEEGEMSKKDIARLVAALQEIQGTPRLPDLDDTFGCGYNGALYTAGKIAEDALAAVGIPGGEK